MSAGEYVEEAIAFACADESLLAILARPQPVVAANSSCTEAPPLAEDPTQCGVLIVVGGPQYRVGSHRQFALLSRRLAAHGYPAMRFDYRGMGDASGAMRTFEDVSADIAAAIDAFGTACPAVRKVVLWGLCDGAAATLLYLEATSDPRVAGLVLLNPWVRSEVSLAQTRIKHYYTQRLLQRQFWNKLLSGRVELAGSLRGVAGAALAVLRRGRSAPTVERSFQDRMVAGWRWFPGSTLLILSGQDYTAKEFIEFARARPEWWELVQAPRVRRIDLAEADHTFSSAAWRKQVEDATLRWIADLPVR